MKQAGIAGALIKRGFPVVFIFGSPMKQCNHPHSLVRQQHAELWGDRDRSTWTVRAGPVFPPLEAPFVAGVSLRTLLRACPRGPGFLGCGWKQG